MNNQTKLLAKIFKEGRIALEEFIELIPKSNTIPNASPFWYATNGKETINGLYKNEGDR